jgi:hypothetical protein
MKFGYKGFMENVRNFYRRNKALAYITSMMILAPSCSNFLPYEEIITNESSGVDIMMSECGSLGLKTTRNDAKEVFYLWFNEKMIGLVPDYLIEKDNNPTFAFGEFRSPTDGFTPEENSAIEAYNSTSGTPKGKTVLAYPATKSEIEQKVKEQILAWGL